MEKQIDRFKQLPDKIKNQLAEIGHEDVAIGNLYIKVEEGREATIFRIVNVYSETRSHNKIKYTETYVDYQEAKDWDATIWKDVQTTSLSSFDSYWLSKSHRLEPGKSVAEYWQEAKEVISGKKPISFYQDKESDEINNDRAVMSRGSKESLIQMKGHLEQRKNQAELIKAFVGYEMEKKRQELSRIREQLYGVVAEFKKKMEKIMRVITTIELYLGIEEELFQIQSGEAAPDDTPISFRQQVLYMDEEIGRWHDGGADFKNIKEFDEWLLKPAKFRNGILNHEVFLPEKKGMVVFRPRRNKKHYSDDWIENSIKNSKNRETYLFIKNGDNLYRVYTDKITIEPRLFPRRNELMEILKEGEEVTSEYKKEQAKEKIEDMFHIYKQRAALMQGLIDRSEVFVPMKEKINIFRLEETPDAVNFIYDDEATLPSGKLPFKDWWKQINDKIVEGSRILITGEYDTYRGGYSSSYKHSDGWGDRFYLAKNSYDGLKNIPDLPKEGVFEVEMFTGTTTSKYKKTEYDKRIKELEANGKIKFKAEGKLKGRHFTIPDKATGDSGVYRIRYFDGEPELTVMYMPEAEASAGWNRWDTHDRKQRTRFKIFRDDDFVINYDQISLDDVEFYLTSRVDRYLYLEMMPVLEKIYTHRKEEMKQEADFARFVFDRNVKDFNDEKKLKTLVQEGIDWWKLKNKWKRPIAKDDTLALRMIEKWLKTKK